MRISAKLTGRFARGVTRKSALTTAPARPLRNLQNSFERVKGGAVMSNINWAFALFGKIMMIAIAMGLVAIAAMLIKEKIERGKWRRVYKHRFDKPPTAKCYCVDCKKSTEKTEDATSLKGG